jgi:hypothetical protein
MLFVAAMQNAHAQERPSEAYYASTRYVLEYDSLGNVTRRISTDPIDHDCIYRIETDFYEDRTVTSFDPVFYWNPRLKPGKRVQYLCEGGNSTISFLWEHQRTPDSIAVSFYELAGSLDAKKLIGVSTRHFDRDLGIYVGNTNYTNGELTSADRYDFHRNIRQLIDTAYWLSWNKFRGWDTAASYAYSYDSDDSLRTIQQYLGRFELRAAQFGGLTWSPVYHSQYLSQDVRFVIRPSNYTQLVTYGDSMGTLLYSDSVVREFDSRGLLLREEGPASLKSYTYYPDGELESEFIWGKRSPADTLRKRYTRHIQDGKVISFSTHEGAKVDYKYERASVNSDPEYPPLIVQPQPATSFLRVISPSLQPGMGFIYDISGRIQMACPQIDSGIDVSELPSGIYYLILENAPRPIKFFKH